MPNYWCDFEHRPRSECELDQSGTCLAVKNFLDNAPDPAVPQSLVIKQSRADRRKADRAAGQIGTDRGDFISGA